MKKKIILFILTFFVLITPVYANSGNCLDSEKYNMYKDICVPKCTIAQDYVDGKCLPKCRDLQYHAWDVNLNKCVHICVNQPDAYICKDHNDTGKKSGGIKSFFKKLFSAFSSKTTESSDDEKEVSYTCKTDDLCKGGFVLVEGKVLIERGIEIIPVVIGTEVLPGDTVLVEEGAKATLMLVHAGKVEFNKKTKFKVPASENAQKKTSIVTKFFGGIWVKTKNFFQGEKFEPKRNTDSGRRG
ncbi:MAG: hypothetical protein KAR87_04210 [Candidatus Aenigmarchaeota archaeon]|nr:hypothetical protein [Candidatus Aenigmarchaeota archaeon]